MGLVSFADIQNSDDADASVWNSRYGAILNALNGNIDSTNLANDAVTTAKIQNLAVTNAKLAADISPAKFANPYKFRVYKNADQNSIPHATWTTVTWPAEDYDTGGNFASNTFTAPVAGFYHFDVNLATTATGGLYFGRPNIQLYKNGTTEISSAGADFDNGWSMDYTVNALSDTVQLAASDTVVVRVYLHTDGSARGVGGSGSVIVSRWSGEFRSAT